MLDLHDVGADDNVTLPAILKEGTLAYHQEYQRIYIYIHVLFVDELLS